MPDKAGPLPEGWASRFAGRLRPSRAYGLCGPAGAWRLGLWWTDRARSGTATALEGTLGRRGCRRARSVIRLGMCPLLVHGAEGAHPHAAALRPARCQRAHFGCVRRRAGMQRPARRGRRRGRSGQTLQGPGACRRGAGAPQSRARRVWPQPPRAVSGVGCSAALRRQRMPCSARVARPLTCPSGGSAHRRRWLLVSPAAPPGGG